MAPNANNEMKGAPLRLWYGVPPLFRVVLLLSCVGFVVSSSLDADDGGGSSAAAAGDEIRATATPMMTTKTTLPVPPRSWDTVQSMAQFFSSNLTGPYDPRAVEWIATNFGSVVLDQWHDLRNHDRDVRGTSQEDAILTELGRIKAVNPSVVTGLYVNTICYYPQYDLTSRRIGVDDTNWLDVDGSRVQLGCSGCTPGPVPDWRRSSVARIFNEWARNVSSPSLPLPSSSTSSLSLSSGVEGGGAATPQPPPPPPPDLLFVDRVTDPVTHSGAVPNFTHLSLADRVAFNRGKWTALSSVDTEIIPLIGADVEGEAPPDALGTFRAGLVQFCVPGDGCLRRMRDCRLRGLICFVHVDYEKYGAVPSLATFLIGAYEGAYIVKGPWKDEKEYGDQWKLDHVGSEWNEPLGRPLGPAQRVAVGGGPGSLSVYVRRFDSGTEVWLDGATGEARITWGGRRGSASSLS